VHQDVFLDEKERIVRGRNIKGAIKFDPLQILRNIGSREEGRDIVPVGKASPKRSSCFQKKPRS